MVDLTDFRRYKTAYLIIVLFVSIAAAFQITPFYTEIFTDISVKPPADIRKTDFSWVTVEEWFNTQARLITSHSILGDIRSGFGEDKLREMISAKRIGASDIVRISLSSRGDEKELKRILGNISETYLAQLNETSRRSEDVVVAAPASPESPANMLWDERLRMVAEAEKIKKELKSDEAKLKPVEARLAQLKDIKARISRINNELRPMNAELEAMRKKYTDNWPAVAGLKIKADILENEKRDLAANLSAEKALEDEKAKLTEKIDGNRKTVSDIENELKKIDIQPVRAEKRPAIVKEKTKGEKEVVAGHIITPPTRKIFPELWIRLSVCLTAGLVLWLLLGLVLKNAYLFWVLKNRIFSGR